MESVSAGIRPPHVAGSNQSPSFTETEVACTLAGGAHGIISDGPDKNGNNKNNNTRIND